MATRFLCIEYTPVLPLHAGIFNYVLHTYDLNTLYVVYRLKYACTAHMHKSNALFFKYTFYIV